MNLIKYEWGWGELNTTKERRLAFLMYNRYNV